MHLERFKIKNFLPAALALWALPHTKHAIDVAYSNLLLRALYGFNYYKRVENWSEMRLERFKNQQLLTKGVRTPLPLDPHPPQPWPFGSWHIIDVSYSYLYLTFYKDLCMV